jgi:phage gp45-like
MNVTSVLLTAGDWQVCGEVRFIPAGTTTVSSILAASNTTSATFPADPDISYATITATLTTGVNQRLPVDCKRYSLSSTTTVFLVAQAAFATSTMTADGSISGRRMR